MFTTLSWPDKSCVHSCNGLGDLAGLLGVPAWCLLSPSLLDVSGRLVGACLNPCPPLSPQVLYPVCHVRNLMLWSAVYLPCPCPSTPVDDSCAPYPAPGSSPDEPPLSR